MEVSFPPALVAAVEEALCSQRAGKRVRIGSVPHIEFRCVADGHDDRHPSAHFNIGKRVWRCRSCPGGGGFLSLCKALGIDPKSFEDRAKRPQRAPGQQPVRVYQYRGPDGKTYTKARFEFPDILTDEGKPKKTFEWAPRFAEGVTVADMGLYWLEDPNLRPDDPVVFVEGEKCVEACWQRGILATCGAWGASQREFGPGLDELRGRTVWLAPDNDPIGREYMDSIAGELRRRGLCGTSRWVRVPLGAKEDLHDFFARGGLPDAIWQGDLADPTVDSLGVDHFRIRMPTPEGILVAEATELQRTTRSLDCKATFYFEGPGSNPKARFIQRVNALSATAKQGLRLDLARFFNSGKEMNWTEHISNWSAMLEDAYVLQDNGLDVFDIEDETASEALLLGELLVEHQPTIVFGDGGSLKSYVSLSLGLHVALGALFPGEPGGRPNHGPVLYFDAENVKPRGLRRRVRRLMAGMGLEPVPGIIHYWDSRGISLPQQIDALLYKVRKDNIRLIIVDSAGPACGGKPEDSDVTTAFFNALSKLGIASIVIAHVTKSGDLTSTMSPFGSAFWRNLCRRAWYIRRAGAEGGDDMDLGLYCRKVNDGPMPMPRALGVSFEGSDGPIYIGNKSFLQAMPELDRLRPMPLRLRDVLATGPLPAATLASRLGSKAEVVTRALRGNPDWFLELPKDSDADPVRWAILERNSA